MVVQLRAMVMVEGNNEVEFSNSGTELEALLA